MLLAAGMDRQRRAAQAIRLIIIEPEPGGAHPTAEDLHMRPDIVPGAIFPDYELSDHTAKRRKLSELQGQHPMVLVLSRGGFCPKDRRQAEGLVALHRELEVAYCRLVTISTDNITETRLSARERLKKRVRWSACPSPSAIRPCLRHSMPRFE